MTFEPKSFGDNITTIEQHIERVYQTILAPYEGRRDTMVSRDRNGLRWRREVAFTVGAEVRIDVVERGRIGEVERYGRSGRRLRIPWHMDSSVHPHCPVFGGGVATVNAAACMRELPLAMAQAKVYAEAVEIGAMLQANLCNNDLVYPSGGWLQDRENAFVRLREAEHQPGCAWDVDPEEYPETAKGDADLADRWPRSRCSCGSVSSPVVIHEADGSVIPASVVSRSKTKALVREYCAVEVAVDRFIYRRTERERVFTWRPSSDSYVERDGNARLQLDALFFRPAREAA